jgi:hypothetical protein
MVVTATTIVVQTAVLSTLVFIDSDLGIVIHTKQRWLEVIHATLEVGHELHDDVGRTSSPSTATTMSERLPCSLSASRICITVDLGIPVASIGGFKQ